MTWGAVVYLLKWAAVWFAVGAIMAVVVSIARAADRWRGVSSSRRGKLWARRSTE